MTRDQYIATIVVMYDETLEPEDFQYQDGRWTIDGMPPMEWARAMFADDPDDWQDMGIPPNAGSAC